MLEKQERLAVVDRATDTIEVEGQRRSFTSLQRVRDELWHNWALSEENADSVCFRIQSFMMEARNNPAPILHMNGDGLVLEYNDAETGHKRFEKISGVKKNNS